MITRRKSSVSAHGITQEQPRATNANPYLRIFIKKFSSRGIKFCKSLFFSVCISKRKVKINTAKRINQAKPRFECLTDAANLL